MFKTNKDILALIERVNDVLSEKYDEIVDKHNGLVETTKEAVICLKEEIGDKTNDNRVNIECLEQKVEELLSVVEKLNKDSDQIDENFAQIDENFVQHEDQHNDLVLKVSEDTEDIKERLDILEKRYDLLNRYDDVNREKFDALCRHFNVFFRNRPQECIIQPVNDDDSVLYSKA